MVHKFNEIRINDKYLMRVQDGKVRIVTQYLMGWMGTPPEDMGPWTHLEIAIPRYFCKDIEMHAHSNKFYIETEDGVVFTGTMDIWGGGTEIRTDNWIFGENPVIAVQEWQSSGGGLG